MAMQARILEVDALAGLADTTLDHVARAEFLADLADVGRLACSVTPIRYDNPAAVCTTPPAISS